MSAESEVTPSTRDALADVVAAWEALSEGRYHPQDIERWLRMKMKPAIDAARDALATPPAPEMSEQSSLTPSMRDPAVEIRPNDDGSIDEIVARCCTLHIEQMTGDNWFMGIEAEDGSYWQFWIGAKNRRSHVAVTHYETSPAEVENARRAALKTAQGETP